MIFGELLLATIMELQLVYDRAEATSRCEGYYVEGSLAQRNRNPGNLKRGGTIDSQRHTIFQSDLEGWLALYQLMYKYRHLTIKQINQWYASDPYWYRCVNYYLNKKQT